MKIDHNQVIKTLVAAAPDFLHPSLTERIFCFGSLLKSDGKLFHRGSDVDLLIEFSPSADTPAARVVAIERVSPAAARLAKALGQLMDPPDTAAKLVSLGAVTPFELQHGINIRGEKRFLPDNRFLDLRHPDLAPLTLGDPTRDEFLTEWQDATTILQEAQQLRKSCLSHDATGHRHVDPYQGSHAIPKLLARYAALLLWFSRGVPLGEPEEKYDYVNGHLHVLNLLTRWAGPEGDVEPYKAVLRLLHVRSVSTLLAEQNPISPSDQMLLWEVLVSEALEQLSLRLDAATLPPTVRTAEVAKRPRSTWRPRPDWIVEKHLKSVLHIGPHATWWIPVDGNGLFSYRRQDLQVTIVPDEMLLHPDFAGVHDQIYLEESTKQGGLTDGELVALSGYDTNRVDSEEHPTLHLALQKTRYYRFLASSIDPRSLPTRTKHLRQFAPDAQPLDGFPNGVGVCLVVQSSDHQLLFGQRSNRRVGPRRGEWDVSVAEGLHPVKDIDPATGRLDLVRAAMRGVSEEVGYSASSDEIELLGFGVDLEFYQWAVIGLVRARASAIDIMQSRVRNAKDRYEYRYLHPVSSDPLQALRFLWDSAMWSSGLAAAYYGLVRLHGVDTMNAAAEALTI